MSQWSDIFKQAAVSKWPELGSPIDTIDPIGPGIDSSKPPLNTPKEGGFAEIYATDNSDNSANSSPVRAVHVNRDHPGRLPAHQWNAEDWRAFFDERAGIAEFDGGQSRQEAEALAYETAAVEWMNTNAPVGLSEDRCAGCGEPLGTIGDDSVPVLAGGGSHAWVHHRDCHKRFQERRKAEAIKALVEMGITASREGDESATGPNFKTVTAASGKE